VAIVAGKIILSSIPPSSIRPINETGNILNQAKRTADLKRTRQSYGLVTYGILYVTQIAGGYGWAVSDYIQFSYTYAGMPNFSW
jgi:hypothetical protein